MKKTYILFFIVIATVAMSCSKPSFEDKAKRLMPKMIDSKLKDANFVSFDISNQTTVYSGDSICIIHFDLKGRTMYGEQLNLPMEYVLAWTVGDGVKRKLYESVYPINSNVKPVIIWTEERYRSKLPDDMTEASRRLRVVSQVRSLSYGRDVNEE